MPARWKRASKLSRSCQNTSVMSTVVGVIVCPVAESINPTRVSRCLISRPEIRTESINSRSSSGHAVASPAKPALPVLIAPSGVIASCTILRPTA